MKLGALVPGILFVWRGNLHVKTAYSTAQPGEDFLHVCVSLGTGEYAHLPSDTDIIPFDLENDRLAEVAGIEGLTETERWIKMRDIAFARHPVKYATIKSTPVDGIVYAINDAGQHLTEGGDAQVRRFLAEQGYTIWTEELERHFIEKQNEERR